MALNARHTVSLFFSFKAHKNIRKLIIMFSSLCVDFGMWCEFFCWKHCLGGSIKSFELVDVHHHLIAYLPLRCYGNRVGRSFRSFENIFWWKGRYFCRWYYWENKQPKSSKVYSSQVTTLLKISLVLPVTNAVSELSTSTLCRIENWFQTSMTQGRSNQCNVLLAIYKEMTDKSSSSSVT